jgi:hypothetical protein
MGEQWAFILPSERVKLEMRSVEKMMNSLRADQAEYVWHCLRSWRFIQGSYARDFLAAMRRAAKKARKNMP